MLYHNIIQQYIDLFTEAGLMDTSDITIARQKYKLYRSSRKGSENLTSSFILEIRFEWKAEKLVCV